jgi:hypothetical protein
MTGNSLHMQWPLNGIDLIKPGFGQEKFWETAALLWLIYFVVFSAPGCSFLKLPSVQTHAYARVGANKAKSM